MHIHTHAHVYACKQVKIHTEQVKDTHEEVHIVHTHINTNTTWCHVAFFELPHYGISKEKEGEDGWTDRGTDN